MLRAAKLSGILVIGTIALAGLGTAVVLARQEQPLRTGVDVLSRMHADHPWGSGCATIETSASFRSGRNDRWYETACPDGFRRIDLLPADSLNGLLFRRDSLYEMKGGQVDTSQVLAHALSILMYDAASTPPGNVVSRLEALGFDLSVVRTSTWRDRPALVIGGRGEDDRNTSQFWIDAERLVPVRLIESYPLKGAKPGDPALVREVWLEDYELKGGRWYPRQLSFFRNGERFLVEKMSILGTDVAVDSIAFRPTPWVPPTWISTSTPVTSPG